MLLFPCPRGYYIDTCTRRLPARAGWNVHALSFDEHLNGFVIITVGRPDEGYLNSHCFPVFSFFFFKFKTRAFVEVVSFNLSTS